MPTITYIVPAFLLYKSARFTQPPEKFFFVTGVRLFNGGVVILTDLVPVRFSATRFGAVPDPLAVHVKQQFLHKLGMRIEGSVHSHPGIYSGCTGPSVVDYDTAAVWEDGASFLGFIFSEGGRYVRSYNHAQKSVVQIHGEGVRPIGPDLFELTEIDQYSMQTSVSWGDETRGHQEPPGTDPLVQSEKSLRIVAARYWCRWSRKQRDKDPDANRVRFNRLL